MLTREEYEKTLIRMFDSMRVNDEHKGEKSCEDVPCESCPFSRMECRAANPFESIEIVEKWGKEHPLITMEDKFIEMFGHKPVDDSGYYVCPSSIGFNLDCNNSVTCKECTNKFWKMEYIPPKKGK